MMNNILLLTDSHKIFNWLTYPVGTQIVYSYLEAKATSTFDELVFFGLQYYLKEYLEGKVVTKEKIDEAESLYSPSWERKNWEYIVEKHNGKLPIKIKALPEGTVINKENVLLTIENTDPNCYWLCSFFEALISKLWYPTMVASYGYELKTMLLNGLKRTTNDLSLIDFKLHDFGLTNAPSFEAGGLSGCAHLVNFKSSNNTLGFLFAKKYYNESNAGYFIPLIDHNSVIVWTKEKHTKAFESFLNKFPTGPVSIPCDCYDLNITLNLLEKELKSKILQRNGLIFLKPYSEQRSLVDVLNALERKFSSSRNLKHMKVLNQKVRVIQHISNEAELKKIISDVQRYRYSLENVVFTMDGFEGFNRDISGFTFKTSSVKIEEENRFVFKNPTNLPKKSSRPGRFKVIFEDGRFRTVPENKEMADELIEVFCDGEIKQETSLEEIRIRAFID